MDASQHTAAAARAVEAARQADDLADVNRHLLVAVRELTFAVHLLADHSTAGLAT